MSTIERYQPIPWDVLQQQADALAKSQFVPAAYKGKPGDVLAAGLYGQEIGLGISAALSYIHVVQGRPTLSAEGMVALVRSKGHSIGGKAGDQAATVTGKRADSGDEMTVEWTMEMAKRAGLAGKDTWKAYPEAMLWARAVSQLCRMLFPDVLLGLSYTPEEARDMEPVEVINVTTRQTPALEPAEEEAPVPLRQIAQAGPPGMGDSVTYVDPDTGEALRRADGEEEQERRRLIAQMITETKKLTTEQRQAFDTWRMKEGLALTKPAKEHTADEVRRINSWLDNTLGDPF